MRGSWVGRLGVWTDREVGEVGRLVGQEVGELGSLEWADAYRWHLHPV